MTHEENIAIKIAEKYKGHLSDKDMIKQLAVEVIELASVLESGTSYDIFEEIGDCALLLSHILSRHNKKNLDIIHCITIASGKMKRRFESET